MTNVENRMEEEKRDYFWASEIPKLIGSSTPSLSTFYRYVREGKIKKLNVGGPEDAYDGPNVQMFLRGELARKARGASPEKPTNSQKSVMTRELGQDYSRSSTKSVAIDVARYEDLYDLYGLEIGQIGLVEAIAPPTYIPWMQANDHVYWLLYNPENRKEIFAMLGVLPLREEVISRLLRRDIAPSQIAADDVLAYRSDYDFGVYIVSAATKPDQKETIISLMKHLISYWSQQSIQVKSIYASTNDSTEDTPMMRIITECFFVPLNHEKDQWELRPLDRVYQTSFVKEYQKHIEEVRKENSMIVLEAPPVAPRLDELRAIYRRNLVRKGEDYTAKVHNIVDVDNNGFITRRDKNNEHVVWVGPIRNDDDIRSTLRINASLFGASKKYSEDQLVEFRRHWLAKNHDIYRVLEIDGQVVGFIFAMPLSMDVINRLLLSEIKVGDVSIKDLQQYKPNQPPVFVYLQTLGLHAGIQGTTKKFAGSYLIAGMERLITDVGGQGVEIGGIFTRSDEPDGLAIVGRMGFDEMEEYSERVGKLVFSLDFGKDNPSLMGYKKAFASYREKIVDGEE